MVSQSILGGSTVRAEENFLGHKGDRSAQKSRSDFKDVAPISDEDCDKKYQEIAASYDKEVLGRRDEEQKKYPGLYDDVHEINRDSILLDELSSAGCSDSQILRHFRLNEIATDTFYISKRGNFPEESKKAVDLMTRLIEMIAQNRAGQKDELVAKDFETLVCTGSTSNERLVTYDWDSLAPPVFFSVLEKIQENRWSDQATKNFTKLYFGCLHKMKEVAYLTPEKWKILFDKTNKALGPDVFKKNAQDLLNAINPFRYHLISPYGNPDPQTKDLVNALAKYDLDFTPYWRRSLWSGLGGDDEFLVSVKGKVHPTSSDLLTMTKFSELPKLKDFVKKNGVKPLLNYKDANLVEESTGETRRYLESLGLQPKEP